MDHFTKPDDELAKARMEGTLQINFQGYSIRAECDLIGLGMSAIGHIGNTFTQNVKTLPTYYEKITRGEFPVVSGLEMTGDNIIREYVIMRLMCDLRIDKANVNEKFGIDFDEYFSISVGDLDNLAMDSLVINTPSAIIITEKGRYLLRIIAMCFDAYLQIPSDSKRVFRKYYKYSIHIFCGIFRLLRNLLKLPDNHHLSYFYLTGSYEADVVCTHF